MPTDSNVIVLTYAQLKEFAAEIAREAIAAAKAESQERVTQLGDPTGQRRYVYGINGIAELFGVAHCTAQQYKNTFLAPAVSQCGRKIVTDVEKAMRLFHEHEQC